MHLRKIYVRYRDDVPDNPNCYAALDGFRQQGVEVASFQGFGDLYTIDDLGPEVGVHGFVDDTHTALRAMKKRVPPPLDYPDVLKPWLHRDITKKTLGWVRGLPVGQQIFIKPIQHKLFTGYVWDGGEASRRRVVTIESDTPIWTSPVMEFLAEYRVFVLRGEILGARIYRGDWGLAPDAAWVKEAVEEYSPHAPVAYSIDFGITPAGGTWLVEVNDSYALGHYGLESALYAQMIDARWEEMTR